jgi:hypothetical protein
VTVQQAAKELREVYRKPGTYYALKSVGWDTGRRGVECLFVYWNVKPEPAALRESYGGYGIRHHLSGTAEPLAVE